MPILYKYCDQIGAAKILESLELKLPFISKVNDPLECLPIFCRETDKSKIKERCLIALKRNEVEVEEELIRKMDEKIENNEIQEMLIARSRYHAKEWCQSRGCLLSVSKTAQNTLMWAHYAEKHKGAVIGIDFDLVLEPTYELRMHPVSYSQERIRIDISMDQMSKEWGEIMNNVLLNKSIDWQYEQEFRNVFLVDMLEEWEQKKWACFKEFRGEKTWFLRLHASSIKEIIFGLYTDNNLKTDIRKLKQTPKLQHAKLYNAVESETYTFDLVQEKSN